MNTRAHHAIAAAALASACLPCHAFGWGEAGSLLGGMALAVLWLAALGGAFIVLLRRHLRFGETLGDAHDALAQERDARSQAELATEEARNALRRMADQHVAIRELERQRIGRDIHDDLGQHLLALKIDLSMLHLSTAGVHPQLHQKLGGVIKGLDDTVHSLRAIINDLRPLGLEQGLHEAIANQMSEFARLHGVACHFDRGSDKAKVHPSCEAALFRILQEALANIARHARATEVRVSLAHCNGQLTLTVQDNGVGMPAQTPDGRGCGLEGIRQRVASAGGQFAIDSTGGVGTRLALSIPFSPAIAAH
jgi:signal transduction histidine kinase